MKICNKWVLLSMNLFFFFSIHCSVCSSRTERLTWQCSSWSQLASCLTVLLPQHGVNRSRAVPWGASSQTLPASPGCPKILLFSDLCAHIFWFDSHMMVPGHLELIHLPRCFSWVAEFVNSCIKDWGPGIIHVGSSRIRDFWKWGS